MKKIVSLILTLLMTFSIASQDKCIIANAQEIITINTGTTSGSCGNNATWSYNLNTNTLTIDGKGDMNDYSNYSRPWYSFCSNIENIIISDGITSIGEGAFCFCDNLTYIVIPDSVTSIGNSAFYGCDNLADIKLPNNVKSIGSAFSGCGLVRIEIPSSVTSIDDEAFEYCDDLSYVMIPYSVTNIGRSAFYGCDSLTNIEIPNSVTNIGRNAFGYCKNLIKISIPDGVISIGDSAFKCCENLISVSIPQSVINIGDSQFQYCDNLATIIVDNNNLYYDSRDNCNAIIETATNKLLHGCKNTIIPSSVTSVGELSFSGCEGLSNIQIPNGITTIENHAFSWCENLLYVSLGNTVLNIGDYAFYACDNLTEISIPSSITSIGEYALGFVYKDRDNFLSKNISFTVYGYAESIAEEYATENGLNFCALESDGFKVYSDYSNLSVRKNNSIRIGVGIFNGGEQLEDISKVTFVVEDSSILKANASTEKDNCKFIRFKGLKEGTTYVTFSDSNTGYTIKVPVTVFDNNLASYTLSSVPSQDIEKYTTNFYNVNGLFVDSYTYSLNDDKTANVSFDVYNTNYIYGAVEVYDADGNMINAVLLDKMTNSSSIKEAVWDNTCCLIRDFSTGNAFTYRQESGYSKKTSVTVEIPANGYIKITTDTSSSFLVAFINGLDILMNLKDIIGDVSGYDVNGEYFSKELTKQIVESKVYAEFVKDSDKYAQKLYKNIAKETLISTEAVGNFADTFATNLNELELGKIIAKTAGSFGWSIGEDLFKYFSGPIGAVLDGMFTFNELTDVILQDNDYIKSSGCGAIYIQNQGGGVRSASQVKVESQTDFTDDTALQVFEFYPDTELLEILKKFNPETYESIRNGITYTYNISMIKNGGESQLENEVTVYIPIPDELKTYSYLGKIKVYRIEEDNTMTELDAEIKNGFLVFKTNHFSLYTISGFVDSTDNYISDVLDYEFETFENGSATITKYNGIDIKIAVPNTIDGYVVTNIAENAFSDCMSLTGVEIPDSVKVIESNAFKNCSNLKAVTIPESVTTIGYGAFDNISKNCVIYCYIDSAAEKYAKSNNINFKTLDTVINVKKAKKTLYIKEKTTIKVAITNAVGKTTFNSSNKKVAAINANGKVTAKKAGTAKITVTNNGVSKTFKVTIKKPSLNKKNKTIKAGKTFKLKIKGQVGKAKFISSNKKIAKINSKGLITAKKKGNVIIKVKTNGITLKCKVRVKK